MFRKVDQRRRGVMIPFRAGSLQSRVGGKIGASDRSGLAVGLPLLALLLSVSACRGHADRAAVDPVEEQLRRMSLQAQAAHTIAAATMAGIGSEASRLQAELATGSAGALFLRLPAESLAVVAARYRARAPWPLLTIVDLPGGSGDLPPAHLLAALADTALCRSAGEAMGRRVSAQGAHLVLLRASPLNRDEPLPAVRGDPERITRGLSGFVDGVRSAGVAVALTALASSDTTTEPLHWDRARLEALELRQLESLLDGDVEGVELASVRLPALTGDTVVLPASPAAVRGILRRDLAFDGVVLGDLSPASPLVRSRGSGPAAVAMLRAGTDLFLGVEEPAAVVDAIVTAVREGQLAPGRVQQAARQVLRLRLALGLPPVFPSAGTAGTGMTGRGAPIQSDTVFEAQPIRMATLAARAAVDPGGSPLRSVDSTAAAAGLEHTAPIVWPPAPVLRPLPPDSVGMSKELVTRIDARMRRALQDSVFTAGAVAVVRRGGLVMLRGYGHSGRDTPGPDVAPERTLFDVASLTKVVGTATAVALLVDDGKIELEAPVTRYLPEFRGDGKDAVTVQHLLTHTSGLPSGLWLFGSARSREQALHQVFEQALVREPGERVQYSDLGMVLLAELVERVAGMPIDRFLAWRVFAPLGMQRTGFLPPWVWRDQIAPTAELTERDFPLKGVVHDANAFRLGGVAGHAGLFSTARDLAVFGQMMLNGGSYGTLRILAPGTVARFTTRLPEADQRALGWDTPSPVSSAGAYFSARSFGHTGYTGTSLWIDPARELLVVLLTNRTYPEATAREILELRASVHDAAARAITDQAVRKR